MRQIINWFLLLLLIAACMYILLGCSKTELEERCFPMLAAAGYEDGNVTFDVAFAKTGVSGQAESPAGQINAPEVEKKSFQRCMEAYENHLNKQADYNHLKVFVIEEDLLQEKKAFRQMLDYLAQTERFPRNTYVCVVEDTEDIFKLEKTLSQDVGTYLEEYINKHEEAKSHILTLGDLLDEKENQTMILYMPYLDVEEHYIEWLGYVNILGEIWKDF